MFRPRGSADDLSGEGSILRDLLPHLSRQAPRLVVAYGVSLGGVLLTLALPWPLKFLIDDVLAGTTATSWLSGFPPQQQVAILAASMAVLAALTAVVLGLDKILHARVREGFGQSLRDALIQRVYRLSRRSRQDERSGELTMRLVGDVNQVSRLFCKTAPTAIKHLATAVGTLCLTFFISVEIGFTALLTAVIMGVLVAHYGPALKRAAALKRKLEGRVSALTQETINGIEHIQAMGLETRVRRRYLGEVSAALEAGIDEVKAAVSLERTSQILAGLALALVAGAGGIHVVAGDLSLGSLTVCMAYIAQLMKPIEKINEIASSISRGVVRAERVDAIFRAEVALQVQPGAVPVENLEEIVCQNLCYRYPDNTASTINGFGFRFAKGECTAIVGPSGSGKSTLLRLLLRLQTPHDGELLANGVPYDLIDPVSLRSQFAVVLQNAHLFAGTVKEVLTELQPDISVQRVREALFDVRLLDVIDALPGGLDTPIDESGERISGGQKARLLIARALLGDRPVIVLDEPFANIDQSSKRIILGRLNHAKRDRILIVVTHEQELLKIADHVIVMDGAGCAGLSTPPELGGGTHA